MRNWGDAVNYCKNLSLAGHTDWRLPEIGELIGIINYGMWNPAIDTKLFSSWLLVILVGLIGRLHPIYMSIHSMVYRQ